jgi:glycine/D-amino acid oxidase-like deaminating enzyme
VTSLWLDEAEAGRYDARRGDGRVDVAVVGGGITGVACALTLAEAGRSVVLHEAREIAGGASGRNGGFALRGGAMGYDVARDQLGPTGAREYWQLTERSLERMSRIAGDALRPVGSLRLAVDAEETAELRGEHDALVDDGFDVTWLDASELDAALRGHFAAGLVHPADGALQPARWVRRLARAAADAGAEIREGSRVEALDALEADRVVIATDGYTCGLVPELDVRIRPTRGQVLVTEPLPELVFPRPHYARQGYDYWQQTPDGRLVIGGSRDASLEDEWTAEEATTDVVQRRIESRVRDLVGSNPRVTHRWAGIWGTTDDRLPFVGPVPGRDRVWVAAGYSGHGNVLGFACGELVARALTGDRDPLLDLLDPGRPATAAVQEVAAEPS